MKVSLIALGLTLLCSILAVDSLDADIQKVMGTWHVVALATDCKCMLKHKEKMKMGKVILSPREESEDTVTMETTIPMPGGCKKISLDFKKLDNGHYFHRCEWGDKTIEEVDTTHENSVIVKAIHEKDGKLCRVWTLLARSRSPAKATVDTFVTDAEAAGFNKDQIKIMPQEVACSESQ